MVVPSWMWDSILDVPAAARDDAVHGGQAEPGAAALRLGGEERVERALRGLARHSLAVVGDVDAHEPACGLDRHGHAAAARHRVAGVEHEVHQHLLELAAVGEHVDGLGGRDDRERDVLAERAVEQPLRLERDAVDVDGLEPEVVVAAEDQQLPREVRRALGGAHDLADVGRGRVLGADLLADELGVVEDHGQQVVEVVRHAACELAERLHALRALERRLERLLLLARADAVGDVGRDAAQARRVAVAVDDRHGGAQQLARLAVELDEARRTERVPAPRPRARAPPRSPLGAQPVARGAPTISSWPSRLAGSPVDPARRPRPPPVRPGGHATRDEVSRCRPHRLRAGAQACPRPRLSSRGARPRAPERVTPSAPTSWVWHDTRSRMPSFTRGVRQRRRAQLQARRPAPPRNSRHRAAHRSRRSPAARESAPTRC